MSGRLVLMLAQIEGAGGMWDPLITFLEVLVGSAATLGIMAGALIVASSPHDDERRVLGWELIGGAITGGLIGLFAVPLYKLFEGWLW